MRSHPYTPPPPLPPILNDLAAELSTILPNQQSHLPATRCPNSCVDVDSDSQPGIPLEDLDPDTSRLLPARPRRQHHVRVQGRLALVRSVSTVNLHAYQHPPRGRRSCSPIRTSKDLRVPLLAAANSGTRRANSAGTGTTGSDKARRRVPRFESAVGSVSAVAERRGVRRRKRRLQVDQGYPEQRRSLDGGLGPENGSQSGAEWECEDGEDEEDGREMYARDSQLRGYGIGGWGNIREFSLTLPLPYLAAFCCDWATLHEINWFEKLGIL